MLLSMFDRSRYYVSLGDSISIDDYAGGSGRGAASLLLSNRDKDFPEWSGKDLRTVLPGAKLVPLAMDGATSATLRYVQIPRLKEQAIRPEIATITIGGNDLVITFGNNSTAEQALASVREHTDAALQALRGLMGEEGTILLGTIYDPSDGSGATDPLRLGTWPDALKWLARFNDAMRDLARQHHCLLADIHARFMGHGLSVGNPSQNDPRPENRDLWYCGTIEPNAWGASAVRAVWWEALTEAGKITMEKSV